MSAVLHTYNSVAYTLIHVFLNIAELCVCKFDCLFLVRSWSYVLKYSSYFGTFMMVSWSFLTVRVNIGYFIILLGVLVRQFIFLVRHVSGWHEEDQEVEAYTQPEEGHQPDKAELSRTRGRTRPVHHLGRNAHVHLQFRQPLHR